MKPFTVSCCFVDYVLLFEMYAHNFDAPHKPSEALAPEQGHSRSRLQPKT